MCVCVGGGEGQCRCADLLWLTAQGAWTGPPPAHSPSRLLMHQRTGTTNELSSLISHITEPLKDFL